MLGHLRGKDIDANTSFHATLRKLLASCDFSVNAYSLPGAQDTVLGWPTANVSEWLKENAITIDGERDDGDDAYKYSKPDVKLAHKMSKQCMASLERQVSCAKSLRKLKQPLFEHCRRFFNAVARVEFTLPSPGGRDDDSEPVHHSMAKYSPLFKRVLAALDALLEEMWKKVEMQTLADPTDPSTDKRPFVSGLFSLFSTSGQTRSSKSIGHCGLTFWTRPAIARPSWAWLSSRRST